VNRPVKEERTGLRDDSLSRRHRTWGFNCPAADIDWMVIEYDRHIPKALVDYKYGLSWAETEKDKSNLAALSALASGYCNCGDSTCGSRGNGIPFVIVRYIRQPWQFMIEPRNECARTTIPESRWNVVRSEKHYVGFLYWLGQREVPLEVEVQLDTIE